MVWMIVIAQAFWIVHLLNKVKVLEAAVKVGRDVIKRRNRQLHDARQNQGQG